MSDLFLLSEAQMRRIERYFPLSHGVARVDDRRVISGIIFVIRNGLRWRDAPGEYGPHKTIYNRFIRWSRLGVFNRIFAELARKAGKPISADDRCHASEGASHRCQPFKKGAVPRRIGRTKGGLNSKLHAVCDGQGRPAHHAAQRRPDERLQRRGADARCPAEGQAAARRQGLRRRLVPHRPSPNAASPPASRPNPTARCRSTHDRVLYRQRHKIENMFGRLKDWRRIHTRYDRCAHTFMSAICIAATVIFWL